MWQFLVVTFLSLMLSSGIFVVDVSDPLYPVEVSAFDTSGLARDIVFSGAYTYVSDNRGGMFILQFSSTPNQAPKAMDDSGPGFTTDEDTSFLTSSVLSNDFDPDGDTLFLDSYDDSGVVGVLIYLGEGFFAYSPDEHFEWLGNGDQATDIFTYIVSDGVLTDTATVTLTITGINDVPIVQAGNDRK